MDEIVVVGNEEFTLGFELVGIRSSPLSDLESLLSKGSGVGVIILSSEDYETLSLKVKKIIDTLLKPIVVILSSEDIKGGNLRELVVRALGVDLLK
jgi:vacuolar-type H+-ATPase subunit F/Vma7